MIPEEITMDLRNGLSLQDTLVKHGTNLKELFSKPSNQGVNLQQRVYDDYTWILHTRYDTYRIVKVLEGRKLQYGTYMTHEDALIVRNELIKHNWDITKLDSILKYTGITRNRTGGV